MGSHASRRVHVVTCTHLEGMTPIHFPVPTPSRGCPRSRAETHLWRAGPLPVKFTCTGRVNEGVRHEPAFSRPPPSPSAQTLCLKLGSVGNSWLSPGLLQPGTSWLQEPQSTPSCGSGGRRHRCGPPPLQLPCDLGGAHTSGLAVTLSAISVVSQSWVHGPVTVFTH